MILKIWDTVSGKSRLAPVHLGSVLILIAYGDKSLEAYLSRVECWVGGDTSPSGALTKTLAPSPRCDRVALIR